MAARARASNRLFLLFAGAGLAAIALFLLIREQRGERLSGVGEATKRNAPSVAAPTPFSASATIPDSAKSPSANAGSSENSSPSDAQAHLREAQLLYNNYKQATRYPPESQPLRDHSDRMHPFAPVGRSLPLKSRGQASADVQVQLTQERLGLTGAESTRLFVRCEDSLHATVACAVQNARINVAPHLPADRAARFPPAAIAFADDGRGGDDGANDGTHTALLQPSAQGFAGYSGPLHITFTVQAGSEAGELFFDLLYGATTPARFTGKVREAVEAGSLSLYVEVEVKQAGRYILTGRVDDNRDQPFAYAQFADALSQGTQEVKLQVFGKLIRDESPSWPLKLRDLDGFILFEDRDPDRQELAPLPGVVYRTQIHSPGEFSADEWQSEERDRHLKELEKDVHEAKSQPGAH